MRTAGKEFECNEIFSPIDRKACPGTLVSTTLNQMQTAPEHLERQGFSILPTVFSHREMERLKRDLEQSGLPRSKAGIRHALRQEGIRSLAADPDLLNFARRILGDQATAFRATLFDKSPQANWLVVWHQDTVLPIQERHDVCGWGPWSIKDGISYAHAPASALCQVLALRVHFDESNADNGPPRVLPGTHMKGVLTDAEIEKLAAEARTVDCLVPQGGVLAMRPLIVHASSKSRSPVPRRVVHIEYSGHKRFAPGLELALT